MTSLARVAAKASEQLEGADPRDVIGWAADAFGDRLCLTSSMADTVLVHLAATVRPGLDVLFLDTGYHFGQTIATRDVVAARLPVNVVTVTPEQTVAEQDAAYGRRLYAQDPDLCCRLRKVDPLDRALRGYDAWASGIRRDESPARRSTPVVGWDAARGKVKVNPLACWTHAQVEAYAREHDVVVNPLVPLGFASVGCAPCTRPVAPGEDARAGRWAGTGKTECGLHV
jgi:phosphoadenosine phosphosulfate reductase